ncbi:hypothetical protein PS925_05294 [Pseudomonas fluorescens]|uniref:Uncharacterized protein n=1 Tax=Pseudomonas fluorescens TaxID=294 RepID=A0A5E7VL67_PSEFL|nr:DUF2254 domain-containing protein [Pseudomonas fluorescens]VVQ23337.1 hypothetical protein PS925_05294 [Pseudomonas fluorescens]
MNVKPTLTDAQIIDARHDIERRRRARVVLMAIPALAGLLLFIISSNIDFDGRWLFLNDRTRELLSIIAASLIAVSALAIIMIYLQTGFKFSREEELESVLGELNLKQSRFHQQVVADDMTDDIKGKISELRNSLENIERFTAETGTELRNDLIKEFRFRLEGEASEHILRGIQTEISKKLESDLGNDALISQFGDCTRRLKLEIDSLGRRGNLNLGLGAITTLAGVLLLGASVFSELTVTKDWWGFVSHFAPRLTLVILIELFAYFFLSLYKASLSEIKFFQNELTNIESKQIALRAAMSLSDPIAITNILNKLADTERNHVLDKNQTTVELEKARIEMDSKVATGKFFSDFFQKINVR